MCGVAVWQCGSVAVCVWQCVCVRVTCVRARPAMRCIAQRGACLTTPTHPSHPTVYMAPRAHPPARDPGPPHHAQAPTRDLARLLSPPSTSESDGASPGEAASPEHALDKVRAFVSAWTSAWAESRRRHRTSAAQAARKRATGGGASGAGAGAGAGAGGAGAGAGGATGGRSGKSRKSDAEVLQAAMARRRRKMEGGAASDHSSDDTGSD